MDPRDLARDTSGTRAYADFLVELSARVPTQIIPNISVLLCHLNGEVCEKMLFFLVFFFFSGSTGALALNPLLPIPLAALPLTLCLHALNPTSYRLCNGRISLDSAFNCHHYFSK